MNPGEDEVCDDVDNDCDGDVDEDSAIDITSWYADDDEDGYGDAGDSDVECEQPSGYIEDDTDCDDDNADEFPGQSWWPDADGDGYGDESYSATVQCLEPSGYVSNDDDCDDTEELAYTGAAEVCDDVDNNCDGSDDPDILVPYDESTVQDALDAAWADDWICVLAGTYAEGDLLIDTRVVLEGEDKDTTVLDGSGTASHILKVDIDDAEVRGFQLTDSSSSILRVESGHTGIVLEDLLVEGESLPTRVFIQYGSSEVTWRRIDVIGNTVTSTGSLYGAALYVVAGSTAILENVRVMDNVHQCPNQCIAQLYVIGATVEVYNSVFSGNEALETDGAAWVSGGVWTHNSTAYAENVSIVGNSASSGTGHVTTNGWYSYKDTDVVELVNVDISHNKLDTYGSVTAGGISAHSSASVTASYTNVYGNDGGDWDSTHDPGTADGNISADPDYTDVAATYSEDWDLAPGASSSLTDAGDPTLYDVDGSTSDIGALGGELGESF